MKLKTILAIVGTVAALGIGSLVFYEARSQWVDAGYVGILYDASKGVSPDIIKPRRVLVGWRKRLYTYPTRLQSAKYVQASDEGEAKAADGIQITTSDNANTTFDVCVVYRVKPENALKGSIFTVNAWRNDPLVVPAEFAKLRFWRNTEVAALKPGEQAVFAHGILGHEWNEDLDNGFRPPGLMRMSPAISKVMSNLRVGSLENIRFDATLATVRTVPWNLALGTAAQKARP